MNNCKNIAGLVLDKKSLSAIEGIRRRLSNGAQLQIVMPVGLMATLFTRTNIPTLAWNIKETEWVTFAKTLKGIPQIVQAQIKQDAGHMVLQYQSRKNPNDYKLYLFWEAIYNGGCKA